MTPQTPEARPPQRYRNYGGVMDPDPEGQWVHIGDMDGDVKEWVLDPAIPGDAARAATPAAPEALLDADEEAAMARLTGFMGDLRRWGLSANETEMVAAIHVLQGFVIQHAIARHFTGFNDWFAALSETSA